MLIVGSCAGTLYAFDKQTGEVRWSYDVRQDGAREFHGDPLLAADSLIIGSDGADVGVLYAFDIRLGQVRWQDLITSGPPQGVGYTTDLIRRGSSVIAGAFGDSVESFEINTGAVQWEFRSGFGAQERRFTASPALIDSTVFFGGQDGVLYALDAATGEGRWRRDLKARIRTSVTTDGTSVYLGTEDGGFYKINPANGEALDSAQLRSRFMSH